MGDRQRIDAFFADLTRRVDEVKQHCGWELQLRAPTLSSLISLTRR